MNRAQRRKREKDNRIRRVHKGIVEQTAREIENQRVEAMLMCFALAVHEEFGFGKKRCMRVLNRLDSYMEIWVKNERSIKLLQNKLMEEVGIYIEC